MMLRKTIAVAAALAYLTSSAHSTPDDPLPSSFATLGPVYGTEVFSQVSGPVTKSVIGDLNGDLFLDSITLSGNRAVLLSGVGFYDAGVLLGPQNISDMAFVPGVLEDPPRDVLAFSKPNGLRVLWWNDDTGTIVSSLLSASCSNARHVAVGHFDQDPDERLDVVTVLDLGPDLSLVSQHLNLRRVGGQWQTDPGPAQLLSYSIEDLTVMQYDGVGTDELAIVNSTHIRFLNANLTEAGSSSIGSASQRIMTIETPDAAPDRAAALLNLVPGAQLLYAMDSTDVDSPLSLAGVEIVGATVGDTNIDGRGDLIISQAATSDLLVFDYIVRGDGQGGQPPAPYDWLERFQLLKTVASGECHSNCGPGTTEGTPVVADLDHDGDGDIHAYVAQVGGVRVLRSKNANPAEPVPPYPTVLGSLSFYNPGSGIYDLDSIDLVIARGDRLPQANYMEVIVWHQSSAGAGTDLDAVDRELQMIPVGENGPYTSVTIDLGTLLTPDLSPDVLPIEIRAVVYDESEDTIRTAGPARCWLFLVSEDTKLAVETVHSDSLGDFVELGNNIEGDAIGVYENAYVPAFYGGLLPDPR